MRSANARWLGALLTASACASCGGSTVALPLAPVPTPPPTRPAPSRVDLGQSFFMPIDVGALPDGRRAVLMNGMRFAVGAGRAEIAPDMVETPLTGAVSTASGWRFLDTWGVLWSAPDFLAPLARAGDVGTTEIRGVDATGVIAVLTGPDSDRLSLTDGIAPLRLAIDQPVIHAAFLDPLHGLATIEGGLLVHTADGGASWQRVAVDEPAVARIQPWGDTWRISLTGAPGTAPGIARDRRVVEISRDGTATIRTMARNDFPVPIGELGAFLLSLVEAAPALLGSFRSIPFSRDHFVLGGDDEIPDLFVLDARGHLVERIARSAAGRIIAAHGLPAAACALKRWGGRVLALCPVGEDSDSERTALFASDDGRDYVPFAEVPARRHEIVAGSDGQSVVWTEDDVAIVAAGERRLRLTVPGGVARILGLHGTRAFVRSQREGEIWVGDAERATPTKLTLEPSVERASVEISEDGTVVLCGDHEDDEENRTFHCWMLGADGNLRHLQLPDGALAVSFLDRDRGVAVGVDLGQLFRTSDSGASWEPSRIPGIPAGRARPPGRGEWHPSLYCFPERCIVGGSLFGSVMATVWGWGNIESPANRVLASTRPPDRPSTSSPPVQPLALTCAPSASPPPRFRPPRPTSPDSTTFAVTGGEALGRVVVSASGDAQSARIEWWGQDDRGTYSVASRATPVRDIRADSTQPIGRGIAGVLSRGAALVYVCATTCDAWWARAGHSIVRLPDLPIDRNDPGLAVRAPSGGVTILGGGYRSRAIRAFDADGRPTAQQPIDAGYRNRALGLLGTADAAVMLHPLVGWRSLPIAGGAMPAVVAPASSPPFAPCTGPSSPATPVAILASDRGTRGVTGLSGGQVTTTLELRTTGACVRSIELWPAPYDDPDIAGRFVVRSDGTLMGWRSGRDQIQAMECRSRP